MLDLNALESFVVAAETLNFSLAAERRNTVQSAISAHIRKLESETGQNLFERGRGRAMHLTSEGQIFLAYARRILALSDEAVVALRESRAEKVIRLGTTVTLATSVVVEALQSYWLAQPEVQIQIICERSDALLPSLDAGEIDVAFMMDQGKRSDRVFVENDQLVWVSGPQFQLPPHQSVPLVFLTDGRDLRKYAFDALDCIGREGTIAHSSPHPIGVRAFALAGLAVTVMPSSTVAAPLEKLGPDQGFPLLGNIGLSLYQRSVHPKSENDELISHLRTALRRAISVY